MIDRLVREHPDLFAWTDYDLYCSLTGERIRFNKSLEFKTPGALYISALDALAMQVQEDIAIVSTESGRDWLSAIHLSFPNFWAAEEKIGKRFPAVHEPVAGMEQMNRHADHLVRVMLEASEGLVRFAWGITWDDELNHHPNPPADGAERPRAFDPKRPRAYLRVERQTVWGFPDVNAALFTIRTYLYDVAGIRSDPARAPLLRAAIESMKETSLAYKRLVGTRDALLNWLGENDKS
jgi:hypothetical protein